MFVIQRICLKPDKKYEYTLRNRKKHRPYALAGQPDENEICPSSKRPSRQMDRSTDRHDLSESPLACPHRNPLRGWALAGTNSLGVGGEEGIDIRNISYLDFSPQDNICVTGICETENSSKLLCCEIANVANFELGGLARDQRGVLMSRSENRCGKRTDAPGCPSLALQPRSCPR